MAEKKSCWLLQNHIKTRNLLMAFGRRRAFRRFKRPSGIQKPRKSAFMKKKPPLRNPVNDSSAERLNRLGGSFHEMLTSSVYSWQTLPPLVNYNSSNQEPSKLRSLKSLCALELAKNVKSLDFRYFDLAPWVCWKLVWTHILRLHNDSFDVARIFVLKFQSQQWFRCHLQYTGVSNLAQLRYAAIESSSIPGQRNHRFENMFRNINFAHFSTYVSGLTPHPWVLIDISRITKVLSSDDYYNLFNIKNLIALDLSNSTFVDDRFLYNLAVSITQESKLKQLTILSIMNCPNVTRKGLQHLLEVTNNQFCCSLSYVESNVLLSSSDYVHNLIKKETEKSIPGTKWSILNNENPTNKILSKLSLGLKLHSLYSNFHNKIVASSPSQIVNLLTLEITINPNFLKQSKDSMVLDIMFHDQEFLPSDYTTEAGLLKLENSWKTRQRARYREPSIMQHCYMANHSLKEPFPHEQSVDPGTVVEITTPFYKLETKRSAPEQPKARKKPRQIATNAKSFFEM